MLKGKPDPARKSRFFNRLGRNFAQKTGVNVTVAGATPMPRLGSFVLVE
jgi:hypothetical protein